MVDVSVNSVVFNAVAVVLVLVAYVVTVTPSSSSTPPPVMSDRVRRLEFAFRRLLHLAILCDAHFDTFLRDFKGLRVRAFRIFDRLVALACVMFGHLGYHVAKRQHHFLLELEDAAAIDSTTKL